MHHAGWLGILQDACNVIPYFLIARDAGGEICGVMTLYHTKNFLGPAHLATLQEGLLADGSDAAAALRSHAEALRDALRLPYVLLRGDADCGRVAEQRMAVVHTVINTAEDSQKIWASLSQSRRAGVRQAVKAGFVAAEEPIRPALRQFYVLYADHMRHLGTPVFGFSMLTALVDRLGEDRLRFFSIRLAGKLVGGMICIANGMRRISSHYVLVDRKHQDSRANYLLYWYAIENISKLGFAEFDLGRSTVDSGVHVFKQRWRGTDVISNYQYFVRPGETRDFTDIDLREGRSLKQRIWQHLPLILCNTVGPLIRRRLPVG